MKFLHRILSAPEFHPFPGGPFTRKIQIRFKKPANTAQTRLESRTRDPKLDLAASRHRRLSQILDLYTFVSSKKRGPYVSLQTLSRWAPHIGIDTLTAGEFVRKYPHIFQLKMHVVPEFGWWKILKNIFCITKMSKRSISSMSREQPEGSLAHSARNRITQTGILSKAILEALWRI